ncbi:MAG: sulfatase [Armatimonadota bacterium]
MRVLYIDLDCCRADHLSINGYHRQTDPNLQRIAAEGLSFRHCYCANSPCVPSRASLFSGRFGTKNGVVTHHGIGESFRNIWPHGRPRTAPPMLAEHLRRQGMKTVTWSSFHERHSAWWFCAGWEQIHTFTRKRGQESADELTTPFLPWLRQHGAEDNWFMHVHFWDIHSHYREPEQWGTKFADDPPPDWPDQAAIDSHQEIYGPRTARDLYTGYKDENKRPISYMPDAIRTEDDFRLLIDGYDGAIAYADHHVGLILDALEELGIADETAIIVSGDHGDSFGEHGQYMDHGIANEPVHNIPMIVKWPGLEARGTNEAMIYGMDMCPTVCELLDLPVPEGWDGQSFAPALRGESFAGWPWQVWTHGIYTLSRAVRTPEWLLIDMLHPGLYPYEEPYYLHDMHSDPHQIQNLAAERPEVMDELLGLLGQWREEQLEATGLPDPLEQIVPEGPYLYYDPERMMERLRATGRGREAEELRRRLHRYHPGRL